MTTLCCISHPGRMADALGADYGPPLCEQCSAAYGLPPHTNHASGNSAWLPAVSDVLDERGRQDRKWGEQNHAPTVWLAILTEEVGELAQTILADRLGAAEHSSHSEDMRTEAVQAAAVAVAFVEYLDRQGAGSVAR